MVNYSIISLEVYQSGVHQNVEIYIIMMTTLVFSRTNTHNNVQKFGVSEVFFYFFESNTFSKDALK